MKFICKIQNLACRLFFIRYNFSADLNFSYYFQIVMENTTIILFSIVNFIKLLIRSKLIYQN